MQVCNAFSTRVAELHTCANNSFSPFLCFDTITYQTFHIVFVEETP